MLEDTPRIKVLEGIEKQNEDEIMQLEVDGEKLEGRNTPLLSLEGSLDDVRESAPTVEGTSIEDPRSFDVELDP